MWTIHSKAWGVINASEVYDSATLSGMVTVHGVTRSGKPLWEKAYLPHGDIKVIVPPDEFSKGV